MKRLVLTLSAIVVGVIFVLVGLPAIFGHRGSAPLAQPPKHGLSFVIEPKGYLFLGRQTNDLEALKNVLLKRSDSLGVRIYWKPLSESRIRVVVATRNPEAVQTMERALFRHGLLEFRLVHEDSDRLIATGEMPFRHELLEREELKGNGERRTERVVVRQQAEPGFGRDAIARAMVVPGNFGEPEIQFTMQPEAAAAFARITRENVGRRLAIVVDGKLYSAPMINSPIETGSGMITGNFDRRDAFEIANALDCPLPMPVNVIESKQF